MVERGARGRWAAPGRVNLIGEHLDYNGGPVLPIAIDRRTMVEVEVRGEEDIEVTSDSHDGPVRFSVDTSPGDVEDWAAYVAGVFWALRDAGHRPPAVGLRVSSNVPAGAGLSSSAALECAVAVALRDLGQLLIDDIALALLAQRAENDYVGVPSGAMDQLASVCAKAGNAVLIDTVQHSVTPVPARWREDRIDLLVIDTRAQHSLGDGEYAQRRRECEAAAAALGVGALAEASEGDESRLDDDVLRRRTRHVATEVARVHAAVDALRDRQWRRLGELFDASHASLRDDFEVSSAELDAAVDAAVTAGALGARMTGGGFGGSAIALVPQQHADAVADQCRRAFANAGWEEPHVFAVEPAAGAGRVE